MSAEKDSSTRRQLIYIPLLNEGTSVVRPTLAEALRNDVYRVLATPDYDPRDEEWEFPPGTLVFCEKRKSNDQEILVAKRRASFEQ